MGKSLCGPATTVVVEASPLLSTGTSLAMSSVSLALTKRHKLRQHPGLELLGGATSPVVAGPAEGGTVGVTGGYADFLHVEAIGPEHLGREFKSPDFDCFRTLRS